MGQFEKTWHYDEQGRRVCTMLRWRNPIMDGIRRFGLHPPQEETLPDEGMGDVTSLSGTLIVLSGNQTVADALGYRDDLTGDVLLQEVRTGTVMVILMKEPRRRM